MLSGTARRSLWARARDLTVAGALSVFCPPSAVDVASRGQVELTVLSYAMCVASDVVLSADDRAIEPSPPRWESGDDEFSIVTYNVAGLPGPISSSDPRRNMTLIGAKLSAYDLVLVQEDFAYDRQLARNLLRPHRSEPVGPTPTTGAGSGLARFAEDPFGDFHGFAWKRCHGTMAFGWDCTSAKGFSVATHSLGGAKVDVYNLHMDSGAARGDVEAREAQVDQLVKVLKERSAGAPVIVAGDTNVGDTSMQTHERLLRETGLRDACSTLDCAERERIDRILYRDGTTVRLEPIAYVVDPTFVDAGGEPLSDHEAVGALFRVR